MFQEERLVQILSVINEKKFVTSEELKNILYVSLSTVRRDLAELNRRGLIIRSHGGAIAKSEAETRSLLPMDTDPLAEIKMKIAKKAAELVNDGDVLFLSASTTVLSMATFLQEKKNLTVVTNSIPIVNQLAGNNILLYGSGGLYSERNGALYGNDAIDFIRSFNYDKAFFSCHSLSSEGTAGYNSTHIIPMVKAGISRAKKRICMLTSNKMHKTSLRNAFSSNHIDLLITDALEVPKDFAQKTIHI